MHAQGAFLDVRLPVPIEIVCWNAEKLCFEDVDLCHVHQQSVAAVARCSSMWSIAVMTVVMLGVPHEKKRVASLKS